MKIDFKKTISSYKAKQNELSIITIPKMQYLMIDGKGDPGSPEFSESITKLYPIAYKLKFMSKMDLNKDYVVPPLEGLWWADNMNSFTTNRDKSVWKWTLLLMVPDWITQEHFKSAVEVARNKKPGVDFSSVRLETLDEGMCVQTLYVGSYDNEGAILEKIHNEFVPENGLKMTGKHHEIYLSDFRKVDPEKLRTILRQPVAKVK